MKKTLCILLSLILCAGLLAACGKTGTEPTDAANREGKLSVVTTIFPEYDWVMNILGDKAAGAKVDMLLDNGVDLHSYQPTAADIMEIASCDVFIYVGGESDKWVEDVLEQTANEHMITVNLLDALGDGVKEEEVKGSMEAEEEEEEDGPAYDEHVWLSLRNAAALCGTICDALSEADPANAEAYRANTDAYREKLTALDGEYAAVFEAAKVKTLVFGDRFPFRYLTDDYGLDYDAAFVGCSAETEASFDTVMKLAKKIDELGVSYLFAIEGTSHELAETIARETASGEKTVFVLDSMQSVTDADMDSVSYLSVMEKNLNVLREALD